MQSLIEHQIRTFIVQNFLYDESDDGLKETDSLLEKGIIDSTGILELVSFLEETYSIQVEDEELIPENLDSIANATAYVKKKQAEGKENIA
jgi:acyl carrier protein